MASNRKAAMQAKRAQKKASFILRRPGEPGKSKYAKKKRGEYQPVADAGRRASWFVRFGWADQRKAA